METAIALPSEFGHGPTPTHTVGLVGDAAESHFANTRLAIREAIGARLLTLVDVKMNQILIAVWRRPTTRDLGGGKVLHLPDKADMVQEQEFQGKTGLVLKLGPRAYVSDEQVAYDEADKVAADDWVVFRAGEGMRLRLHGWDCILTTERGIKMRVPRPDEVYCAAG